MQIRLSSVLVTDQNKALEFYTTRLGFTVVHDIPMGTFRWLTVSSPEGIAEVELVLEPAAFPPAQVYQKALYEAGIPATAFFTQNISAEVERLKSAGVVVRGEPKQAGPILTVLFEDGCGNLLNLVQAGGK